MSLCPRRAPWVLATFASSVLLTSCGGGSDDSGGTADTASPAAEASALAARVPASIGSDGVLTVGTDPTYAPNEFLDPDGKTIIGFNVDLFDAVAQTLGLRTEYVAAPFDAIIPGVQSGKYEVGVSSFTINPERTQVVDMVSYFAAGTQWATGEGTTDLDPADACGRKVAVQRGTVQVDDITARDDACAAAGKPRITIDQYQGQDEASAAVVSGKDEAMLADSPVIAYAVKQSDGRLQALGDIYDSAPYGYVVDKEQPDLAQVLVEAVDETIANGAYRAALTPWGVEQGGIDRSALNQ